MREKDDEILYITTVLLGPEELTPERAENPRSASGVFVTEGEPTETEIAAVKRIAGEHGLVAIVTSIAATADDLGWAPHWIAGIADHVLGNQKPAHTPNPEAARFNELDRAVRNQQRQLDQILAILKGGVYGNRFEGSSGGDAIATEPPAPTLGKHAAMAHVAPAPHVQRRHVTRIPQEEPEPMLTEAETALASAGYPKPRATMPDGDATIAQPSNRRDRPGTTPEQQNRRMDLVGPDASSTIFQVGQGNDEDGNPAIVKAKMPTVGDSLKHGTRIIE
jgi:hypothetical protein